VYLAHAQHNHLAWKSSFFLFSSCGLHRRLIRSEYGNLEAINMVPSHPVYNYITGVPEVQVEFHRVSCFKMTNHSCYFNCLFASSQIETPSQVHNFFEFWNTPADLAITPHISLFTNINGKHHQPIALCICCMNKHQSKKDITHAGGNSTTSM
jgi:hypothetical protein